MTAASGPELPAVTAAFGRSTADNVGFAAVSA